MLWIPLLECARALVALLLLRLCIHLFHLASGLGLNTAIYELASKLREIFGDGFRFREIGREEVVKSSRI